MYALVLITSFVVFTITIVRLYFKYKFSYWFRHNVEFIPPKIPYGNINGHGSRIQLAKLLQFFYNSFKGKGPICGMFFFTSPVAVVLDLVLIKNVLMKDFNHFQDRGVYYNERDDPLSANIFFLDGDKWKYQRQTLTPTFSSGRIKFMFSMIVEVAEQLRQRLATLIEDTDELDLKDLIARFITDVIGTCAFGIDCNSLADANNQFHVMG